MKPSLSNRIIFILSLFGLAVASFLFYEYHLAASVFCPIGGGSCDAVRTSEYSTFFGISIPILGIAFYLGMATLAIIRSQQLSNKLIFNLQLLGAAVSVIFGLYLTFLEIFIIKAICFWCVLSFIISILILLSALLGRGSNENGN